MSDLITLTCPNCGGLLEADSSKMTTKCKFCETEILVKDFITERRVDKSDRIASLQALADNAIKNYDYEKVYNYYEEICKLDPSKENLAYLNYYGYASGNNKLIEPVLTDLYALEPERHRNLVENLRTILQKKKNDELRRGLITPDQANKKYYQLTIRVTKEYNKLKPKKCKCGAILEYNEDVCPKCGTNYTEYRRQMLEKDSAERKAKRAKAIKFSLLVGIPLVIAFLVISCTAYNLKISKIQTAIQDKNFSVAEELLEDYKKSSASSSEVYELYADLYIAENDPKKAVAILEEGLKKVHSGKDDLQKKIDSIKSEYHLQ